MPQILVIDDDPGLLSVCTVGLQALGHTVRTAETGEEGISQAALRAPDVIMLDLGLPDLDGLVVCKRIRTWSRGAHHRAVRGRLREPQGSTRWTTAPMTT